MAIETAQHVYRPLTKEDWLDFINTPVPPPKPFKIRLTSKVQKDAVDRAIKDFIKGILIFLDT